MDPTLCEALRELELAFYRALFALALVQRAARAAS